MLDPGPAGDGRVDSRLIDPASFDAQSAGLSSDAITGAPEDPDTTGWSVTGGLGADLKPEIKPWTEGVDWS